MELETEEFGYEEYSEEISTSSLSLKSKLEDLDMLDFVYTGNITRYPKLIIRSCSESIQIHFRREKSQEKIQKEI
jgi:hypothetical protein